jgi:hypothetical protein
MNLNENGKYPGLGLNVVIKHPDFTSLDKYTDAIIKLKVEWVRFEFNFFDPMDDEINLYFIKKLFNANVKILGLLTGLVPGTFINCVMPSLNFKNPFDVKNKYLEFCSTRARTFHEYINHWEIWNEANTLRFWINKPNHKNYFELAKLSVTEMRKIQPDAKFVLAGIMGEDINVYAPFQTTNFLQDNLNSGIDEYIDIFNIHPYIPACYFSRKKVPHYIENVSKNINAYLEKYKSVSKPHWITEFGVCPLWTKVGQKNIGYIYKEIYKFCTEKNIHFFIWTLTDFKGPEYSKWNPETAFGLLNWELEEKEIMKSFIMEMEKE